MREERGRLEQQVATLEETNMSEQMVTHKLRRVLSEVSKSAADLKKQLSIAVLESQWAVGHAQQLALQVLQDQQVRGEIDKLKDALRRSQKEAETAQHALAGAQAVNTADRKKIAEMESTVCAANGTSDDLRGQLAKALAVNSTMSDRVDLVLADMDVHNRALGVAVEAAEVSRKLPCPEIPVQDCPVVDGDGPSPQVLSISIRLEASPSEKKAHNGGCGVDSANDSEPNQHTAKTPKAALRKRLLDARQALGGVRLGEAPKRSISFHPQFLKGICEDDFV